MGSDREFVQVKDRGGRRGPSAGRLAIGRVSATPSFRAVWGGGSNDTVVATADEPAQLVPTQQPTMQ